ncbi:MAG: hypothetical protein IT372_28880 [Polyangiaceae bacterium]|nr:hypothetical protein [Polyangiaceae bacterium]
MRLFTAISLALTTTIAGFTLGMGCSDDTVDGASTSSTGTTNAGGAGGGTGGGGTTTTTGVGGAPTTVSPCQGHVYECGDTLDNDGDGLIDYQDPDCLGPCDNTEGSYYGGIAGQPGPACTVDCYFDQDSGSGNDDCYWNHQCDPHEVSPDYHPESSNGDACAHNPNANTPGTSGTCDELYNAQSQACHDYCGPLVPNGCDCFGCCELPAGSGQYVWLGSDANGDKTGSCSRDVIDDPTKCEPCLPVAGCLNGCDPCELCLGKDTLPPECYPDGGAGGGPTGQCPGGDQPCGLPGQDPCPATHYCITGCCQEVPQ